MLGVFDRVNALLISRVPAAEHATAAAAKAAAALASEAAAA